MQFLLQEVRVLLDSLPQKIKKSNFKTASLIKMTGIPSATFYKRMNDASFTIDEAEKIVKILELEKKLNLELNKGELDIANNKTATIEELEARYS